MRECQHQQTYQDSSSLLTTDVNNWHNFLSQETRSHLHPTCKIPVQYVHWGLRYGLLHIQKWALLSPFLYDVLSLFINITNNFNLLFRQICIRYPWIGWDQDIPPEEHYQWKMALRQLLEIKDISVPRFVLEGITDYNDVTAILFCDGSDVASATKIYVRFPVGGGKYVARYLTGATKIASKGNNNAPRQECTAVLLACRLFDQVCSTWTDVKFKEVLLCSDSNCALGSVLGRTQAQVLFFSTRNYESKNFYLSTVISSCTVCWAYIRIL